MRPVRLVMEGFSTFRDRVEVDFADAELFALVGPTGAGKSSVIDGITFALYGTVARYDDERLVSPVINQRAASARVDLIFTVGDDRYRAFREVARRGARGTTKEARLERVDAEGLAVGPALAGDARQVSAAVAELLGLDFGQFTTCVVLPQGEFARFLHDTPAHRQALLKRLLDLGLYDEVGRRARSRAAEAGAQLQLLEDQLAAAQARAGAEPEELAARLAQLETLLGHVDEALPQVEAWRRDLDAASRRLDEARGRAASLQALTVPEGIDSVVERVAAADLELGQAIDALDVARARLDEALRRSEEVPALEAIQAAAERREQARQLEDRIDKGRAVTAEAEARQGAAEAARDAATARLEAARLALAEGQRADLAHALADGLAAGDECPVCLRTIDEVPAHDLSDLDERKAAVAVAERDHAEAEQGRQAAGAELTRCRTTLEQLEAQLGEVRARLADDPSPDALDEARAARAQVDDALRAARAAVEAAQGQRKAAERERSKLEGLVASEWGRLDDARDAVAALGPPPVDRRDLAAAWRGLAGWAEERWLGVEADVGAARQEVEALGRRVEEGMAAVVAACREAGVDLGPRVDAPRDALVGLVERTRAELGAAEERRRELAGRLDQRDELRRARADAEELGRLLKAGGFVSWLLEEAVQELLAGATRRLHQLSHGRYSLVTDDKGNFLVVDHGNADEQRLARSLSGGETFLASLSLALALAEEVARISAAGAPRLESIFLDEGFGTLDADTLDVVVTAIEELQAEGRVVGLVSHVVEIADRVPVRFEVRREPGSSSSTIDRVAG